MKKQATCLIRVKMVITNSFKTVITVPSYKHKVIFDFETVSLPYQYFIATFEDFFYENEASLFKQTD
jgi:hypothetical protein